MKVVVTGGYFDEGGDGCVWGVDLASGRVDMLLRYTPPVAVRVATRGFTGGCWASDGALYATGHAAVFRIDPRAWRVDGVLHSPSFNDLHHVAAHEDRLYVANTGSDSVDVFGLDGRFLGSHGLAPGWVLARRMAGEAPSAEADVAASDWSGATPPGWNGEAEEDGYHTPLASRAEVPYWRTRLPDRFHPNHVCASGDALLATCLRDGTIRDVGRHRVVVSVPGEFPHDGVLRPEGLWFTTIDGGVWRATWSEGQVQASPVRLLDVFSATGRYGWCRGLRIEEDTLAIGLTEVRADRLPRHRWAERAPEGSETSVLWMRRADGRLVGRADLSDPVRHSKIYSILPWDGR